jgi:ABC-type glycerol-3-phosphate transport system substrate-binding protein
VKAITQFDNMLNDGLFGDVATGAAPGNTFYPPPPPLGGWWESNDIGMLLCGDWITTVFASANIAPLTDYDFFPLPKLNPKVGQLLIVEPDRPLCVGANSANASYGMEFLDYIMSPAAQAYVCCTLQALATDNIKVPRAKQPIIKQHIFNMLAQGTWRFELRIWEAMPPTVIEEVSTLMDKLAFNPSQLSSIISQCDTVNRAYYTSSTSTSTTTPVSVTENS